MIQLLNGDCLIESDKIENGSVDLILTDLPYGTVKGAQLDGWGGTKTDWDVVVDTSKIMSIANRILRKNGKMLLFAQDPFSTELKNKAIANIPYNYSLVWEKDHFANALAAKKAPVNYYEDILVFSKSVEFEGLHPLRCYFEKVFKSLGCYKKDLIKNLGQRADHVFRFNSSQFDLCTEETYEDIIFFYGIDSNEWFKEYLVLNEIDSRYKQEFASTFNLWEGRKSKSNILKYKKDYDGYHPTQKPILLLEDLIKTYSNEGDLVVDFTMGSGSTGVASINTNRKFTGIEKEKEYFNIAENRCIDAQDLKNLIG